MKPRIISWAILFGALLAFSSCQKDDDDPIPPPQPEPVPLKHAELTVLRKATKGQGIDIVILGDGFTADDRELWEETLLKSNVALFRLEPFRSFREYFNVYGISAVSATDQIGTETPGDTYFGVHFTAADDRLMSLNNSAQVYLFARQHSPEGFTRSQIVIALIANDTRYGGVAQANINPGIGSGISTLHPDFFEYLLIHETLGHALGHLGDEYVEFDGFFPDEDVEAFENRQKDYGIYLNISYTSNPAEWINPSWRTLYESGYPDVGIFEGGHRYEFGVWRSSEYSIMNGLSGGFNAVSREILVRTIYQLAGMEDQYSLDVFLEYDKRNIGPQTRAAAPAIALPPAWYPPI